MPFYFQKSVSAGPFRFNVSQHGFGASIGVKGFRLGTGPRGHYVHAGRNGFYYRATIGQASVPTATPAVGNPEPRYINVSDMIPITSGSVMAMQDSAFSDVLQEINVKNRQIRLSFAFGLVATLFCGALLANGGVIFLPSLLFIFIAVALGSWIDSYKRVVVLFYDDEDVIAPVYRKFCAAFDDLANCAGKWHIQAAKPVYDLTTWKRQAGASRLVDRKNAILGYELPPIIKSNITPPSIQAGGKRIYLLPDIILVQEHNMFGAVGYDALSLQSQASNFIEEQSVPHDTEILRRTWQHPNKDGGPDRRFRINRQLPICRYDLLHFTSNSGINELFEFSRFGVVNPFICAVANIPKRSNLEILLLPSTESEGVHFDQANRLLPRLVSILLWIAGLASIILIFVGLTRMVPAPTSVSAQAVSKPAQQIMFVRTLRLNCRSEPSMKSIVVKTLKHSDRITIVEQGNDWSKAKKDLVTCWIRSSALSSTEPSAMKLRHQRHLKHTPKSATSEISPTESGLPAIY